jgi:hypothetical protein
MLRTLHSSYVQTVCKCFTFGLIQRLKRGELVENVNGVQMRMVHVYRLMLKEDDKQQKELEIFS